MEVGPQTPVQVWHGLGLRLALVVAGAVYMNIWSHRSKEPDRSQQFNCIKSKAINIPLSPTRGNEITRTADTTS